MSGLKIIGVIIFTLTIFTAIMAGLNNTDDEYIITDNNESENVGLFDVPTGMFRGLEESITFDDLGIGGKVLAAGLTIFIGFVVLFWLRGTT